MNRDLPSLYETIADGLAETGYACTDHFLSPEETNDILEADEFKNGLLQFRLAGTGQSRQVAEGVRGDYIQWIDRSKASAALSVYLNRLNELTLSLNRSLFLSLKDYEVHTTIYPAGSFYKRHLDQFQSSDSRKISVICYLNKEWEETQGGQLRMHLPDGPKDFFPLGGRLICFRSDQIEHEVLPAVRDRRSITGWMLDRLAQ